MDTIKYIVVRTGDFENKEAIFYATASRPLDPWIENDNPIVIQDGSPLKKDEIIAPGIFIEPTSGEEILFYTGADHSPQW